ncbi:hypothetical protein HHI36_005623 [Cryptolaemus montrouzieri]|uniref:Uncharacterized protein n=1 Tax=Cryptolaemus montrouzieri TaxID=559131 RepID=A0ABD2NUP9_9CUCU
MRESDFLFCYRSYLEGLDGDCDVDITIIYMNIDILDTVGDAIQDNLTLMSEMGFSSCINLPTSVTKISKTCIPKEKVKRKTWITASLVRFINRKNEMYTSLLRNPEQEDLRSEYKRYRNILTDIIKEAINRYFSDKIENNRGNSKKIMKLLGKRLE